MDGASGFRLIAWLSSHSGGNHWASSLKKTLVFHQYSSGIAVFVLVCFYGPFLGKVGLVDDDFVFFSLFGPGKLVVHIIGHLHKIGC